MPNQRFLIIPFLALALLFSACQPKVKPVTAPLAQPKISPDYLWKSLQNRQNGLTDLRSFVKTTVHSGILRQTFKQIFLIRGTKFMRVDTMNMFGQPMGVLIHKPGSTAFYNPETGRVIHGAEVSNAMRQALGTVIDFDEFISIFSGGIPRLENMRLVGARLDSEKKFYRLTLEEPNGRALYVLKIDAFSLLPARLDKMLNGKNIYSVQWEDYQTVEGREFSHKIILARTRSKEKLTIKYKSPVINHGVSPEVFELWSRESSSVAKPHNAS